MLDIKKPWAKLILWVSAFVSPIVYAITGGFVFLNCEDEELRKENKRVFFVALIFIGLSMLTSIWSSILSMTTYSSDAYKVYYIFTALINIAKIITYVVFAILALVTKSGDVECCCCGEHACDSQSEATAKTEETENAEVKKEDNNQ